MKPLLSLLEAARPLFVKRGKLHFFKPAFDAAEFALFYPSSRTEYAPHVRDALDIKRFMGTVILAMLPSLIAAIYFFGPRTLAMILVSYVVGGTVEVLFAAIRKSEIHEGFLVTGLIFPLTLPPGTPLWIVGVGIFFGTMFGKEVFGGTGKNIFNPALVGRMFITIAFPAPMTTLWKMPFSDAITSATPMSLFKTQQIITPYVDLLWGNTAGSIGETFHIGIIAGGLFLMMTKISNWRIPLSYLGTVFIISYVGNMALPDTYAPPLFQILSGGLLFGAMFMATDPVTAPMTKIGKYLFGIFCGFLTVLIRALSGYVEGVMFSIVIMNAFTPLLDHIVLSVKYRQVKA